MEPANLSFEQAAAVPVSALTALQAVRRAQARAGQKVLIIGASTRSARPRQPSGTSRKAAPAARSSSPFEASPTVPG